MAKRKRKRRLPPMSGARSLVGIGIREYAVGDWCPTTDGSGPPEAVALSLELTGLGDAAVTAVMRLKSPEAVDTMVQALLRHKRSVWPDAP